MIRTETLNRDHYQELYEVVLRNEPFAPQLLPTIGHFQAIIGSIEGFVLRDGPTLIGAVTFTGLQPLIDVCLNIVIDEGCRKRWATKDVCRRAARFAFVDLALPRMSSYGIKDVTPSAETCLVDYGFRVEGVKERGAWLPDGFHDLILYGLLKERCRWL